MIGKQPKYYSRTPGPGCLHQHHMHHLRCLLSAATAACGPAAQAFAALINASAPWCCLSCGCCHAQSSRLEATQVVAHPAASPVGTTPSNMPQAAYFWHGTLYARHSPALLAVQSWCCGPPSCCPSGWVVDDRHFFQALAHHFNFQGIKHSTKRLPQPGVQPGPLCRVRPCCQAGIANRLKREQLAEALHCSVKVMPAACLKLWVHLCHCVAGVRFSCCCCMCKCGKENSQEHHYNWARTHNPLMPEHHCHCVSQHTSDRRMGIMAPVATKHLLQYVSCFPATKNLRTGIVMYWMLLNNVLD